MSSLSRLALLLTLTVPLSAQIVDTLGGTTTAVSRANSGKACEFQVDTTVILMDLEMYLDVPGSETLTWFIYRHHSRTGTGSRMWTMTQPVAGGVGPTFYSTGPIAVPLVAGNHYLIGVTWAGSVTYHYQTAPNTGTAVSFGRWVSAKTIANPPPATATFTGTDVAQYHMRLTTVQTPVVTPVGTACAGSAALAPRLVAAGVLQLGTQTAVDLVDATGSTLALNAIGFGPTVPPIPLFGCSLYLGNVAASIAVLVPSTGVSSLPLAVPANNALLGLQLSMQSAVLTASPGFTNALEMSVN